MKALLAQSLPELIGQTPVLKVPSLSQLSGCEILIKCEYFNPGGSIKDRAAWQMVQEALASAGHVHFAGHGALVAESPWQAHLRLADGRLTLADVLASPLRVSRVVLSGCETGRAGALSSAEHIGLPEALLAAGARSVVAAVEKVDDTATAAFMEAFYAAGGAERPGPALVAARAAVGGAVGAAFQLWGRP